MSSEYINYLEKWDYKAFREYLLLLATKKELGLETVVNYPDTIVLNPDWHETLEDMRHATLDGKERWILVGFKADKRNLCLPVIPATGHETHIPGELMKEEIERAKKLGIVDLLGDIHSHPRDKHFRLRQSFPILFGSKLKASFSAADYYTILGARNFRPFMGVVDGNYNLFAFRSRESQMINIDPAVFTQETFNEYWNQHPSFSRNQAICARHKLVLYQGKAGNDLEKIFSFSSP